jgi:hypothetical protein
MERRPKILRLGSKFDPCICAIHCQSRAYRKRIRVSPRIISVTAARSSLPRKIGNPYIAQSSFAPQATLEHVVHAQFLADLRHGLVSLFIGHGRGTRDHSHAMRRHLPQSHDCLLAQAIAEIFLRRVATQVFEGKNGEHDARPVSFHFPYDSAGNNGLREAWKSPSLCAAHAIKVARVGAVRTYSETCPAERLGSPAQMRQTPRWYSGAVSHLRRSVIL